MGSGGKLTGFTTLQSRSLKPAGSCAASCVSAAEGSSEAALTVCGLVSDAATATGNQNSVSTASRSTVSGSARFSAWHLSVGCRENKGKSK